MISIVAGTSTSRTRVASSAMATARPSPISLIDGTPVPAKTANTATMISAALVIVAALRAQPLGHGGLGVTRRVVALADAREQEDLVVHGEPEDDRQEQRRRHGVDVAERLVAGDRVERSHWKTATSTP